MRTTLKNALTKRDHILGNKNAPLELLEYGDFQCSSCGDSYLAVKEVLRELGQNVAFIFRNFPLTEIHPDAFDAALAAEAAAQQNKFWEMYDLLFQHPARLSGHELFAYAHALGLNMNRFEQDIQSQALTSKIEADMEGGLSSGVSGTPTFYINGEKYEGDWEGDELARYLKNLLR
jgi:protein-disulfide isomerase